MNRLAESSSLYLKQHADNPVDWQPWDDRALTRAREEKRPILLSIGYSACHWCHVMAHECFEDPETAHWMNALFVNIKVDREERPDLDRVYQLSHQMLTGRGGGWPLTLFLDPVDLTPFFAGTYFPPTPRHGLPGFADLLKKVREWYDLKPADVAEQNRRLTEAIASMQQGSIESGVPAPEVFRALPERLGQNYDATNGGFGGAPKFPQAPLLGLLQRVADDEPRGEAGAMLHDTLTRMAMSGLRDHLDGGFFRYTVDGEWTIPHFEKMLYDNAMLLPLYAESSRRRNDHFLAESAGGIVNWLQSEMLAPGGGFFASIDADADGEEGGFHLWSREQVEQALEPEAASTVKALFGLDGPPNFEGRLWHLVRNGRDPSDPIPGKALSRLAEVRSRRTPPATDNKRLTSWNALCIEGLARAGLALGREDWIDLAGQTLDFIRGASWQDGQLFAVYAEGRACFPAYLDDHAGLVLATLALLEARWHPDWLRFATDLADTLLAEFADPEAGGFFFTANGAEAPVRRLRPLQDDALPGGNGVAARALLKLGHLVGESRYLDAAEATLAVASREIRDYPLAHASLLQALAEFHWPVTQVILSGTDAAATARLLQAARSAAPGRGRVACYAIGGGEGLPGILAQMGGHGRASAFVCRGLSCSPPVEDAVALGRLLAEED